MQPSVTVTAESLIQFAMNVYRALGVSERHAWRIAHSLVQADLWGHQSHGILRTFWYATRMQSGAMCIDAEPVLTTDAGAIASLDGQNGIGQVIATEAMNDAIARAKQHGVGVVSVRRSGHFGTGMYFTEMAAKAGCIGFLFTNASPAMAPWGGIKRLIGTNPWSIAAPAGSHSPMMLDIANTAVARGKLYLAKSRSVKIPFGWAMDSDGNPTDNPVAGIAGNILPFAEHKGYAIATMVDMLSGVLSGSRFLNDVKGPYEAEGASGVGHLVIVLNISAFRPIVEFNAEMNLMISRIKSAPRRKGVDEIFYPGELEARTAVAQLDAGIALPLRTVKELNVEATKLGVEPLVVST